MSVSFLFSQSQKAVGENCSLVMLGQTCMTFFMSIINRGIISFTLKPSKKVFSRLVLTASGPSGEGSKC